MLQQVWQAGYDWDHKLTGSIKNEWIQYKPELQHVEDIRIPRWFVKERRNSSIQLHGFCVSLTFVKKALTLHPIKIQPIVSQGEYTRPN